MGGLRDLSMGWRQRTSRAPKYESEVMLAAGGSGEGGVWQAIPSRQSEYFMNSHFIMATRRRLAAVHVPEGARCQIPDARHDGEVCGALLADGLTHPAAHCVKGPARMRPHNHLSRTLAMQLRYAGADVDRERVVPELFQGAPGTAEGKEGIMDVVANFPGGFTALWFDVTIRCPHADRYSNPAHGASSVVPAAAAQGGLA